MSSRQPLARLGEATARRVRAGQSILDPAAVVKELVENSLDAGATKIEVRLRGPAGNAVIAVADNGTGISDTTADGLRRLLARHSTSKIRAFQPLRDGAIASFGFRGEALAMIAELSAAIAVTTRPDRATMGTAVRFDHAGNLTKHEPCPRSRGTTVTVESLFARFPVRQQEARANAKRDAARVTALMQALVLAKPLVRFSFTNDNGLQLSNAPPSPDVNSHKDLKPLRAAASNLFGAKLVAGLSSVETVLGRPGWLVVGLVGGSRSSSDRQFISVRGRAVDFPKLTRALTESHRRSLAPPAGTAAPPTSYPIVILSIHCPDGVGDFNVAPDKRTVLLDDDEAIVSDIVRECETARVWETPLGGSSLRHRASPPKRKAPLSSTLIPTVDRTEPRPPRRPLVDDDDAGATVSSGRLRRRLNAEALAAQDGKQATQPPREAPDTTIRPRDASLQRGEQEDTRRPVAPQKFRVFPDPLPRTQVLSCHEQTIRAHWIRRRRQRDLEVKRQDVNEYKKSALSGNWGSGDAGMDLDQPNGFHKENFGKLDVLAQFNLAFIVCRFDKDLFIIDQHAADEKYNFEKLQNSAKVNAQKLLRPVPMDLSADEETLVCEHLEAFRAGGFDFIISEEKEPTKRVALCAIPFSRNVLFGINDVQELLTVLRERTDVQAPSVLVPARIRALHATRACRKSIMVGTALDQAMQERIVRNLETLENPWNCPHGRPTMRHLYRFGNDSGLDERLDSS